MNEPETPEEGPRPPSPGDTTNGDEESSSPGEPEESEAHRPTPVREMMAPEVGPAADWEPPSRTFEHEGEEWVVTLAGQTVTGLPSDPGAPLMHLHFAPADDPESPTKELLCVGSDLESFYDEELRQYLLRARPYADEGP